MEDCFYSCPDLVQDFKEALKNQNKSAVAKIQEYLKRQNNIKLKIGITGESGTGKSSFVNAFRGLTDNDEGAAPTGCVEETLEIKAYPHPNYPNVILYDLPGIGTARFPAKKYLKHVEFEKFDFFIIISADRFRENDVKLAKAIKKMGKKFYFVRSKIDIDLQNEKRKKGFKKEKSLEKIRKHCADSLRELGFEDPQVFLLSSFSIQWYDFPLLQETLEKELPAHKRDVLLFASPSIKPEIIERRKKAFKVQIWCFSAISGAVAAAPVPGLSLAVDLGLLVTAVTTFVLGLGLDPRSLKRLATRSGVPYEELRDVIKSPLAATEITIDLIQRVLVRFASAAALMAVEEGSRFIPTIGTALSMSLSAITTYRFLKVFLNMLVKDALSVSERVLSKPLSKK